MTHEYSILVKSLKGTDRLEDPGDDNIKTNLKDVGFGDVDWINLVHYRKQ
jgi:hypothetical protein